MIIMPQPWIGIHLETESLDTKRKHFSVEHTTSQNERAALSIDNILKDETEALKFPT